jgi:SAM-dependent methyltransferase
MTPKTTIVKAWVFFSGLAALVLAVVMALRGELLWAGVCAVLALCADVTGRVWSRRSPVPMPYFLWCALLLPRGPHSPKNLERVLKPRNGERILEIGPGIGVHALPVASSLLPNGVLDVLDVQQNMLDKLALRAARNGLTNIMPKQGDAQKLPYPDRAFDAAYLISVLGEIPDTVAALCELKRVLKPRGRLVVSEVLIDPDFISLSALQGKAVDAGFVLERSVGPGFAYSALLRPVSEKE